MKATIKQFKSQAKSLKYQVEYRRKDRRIVDHWTIGKIGDKKIVALRDCKGYLSVVIYPLKTHALQIKTDSELSNVTSAVNGILGNYFVINYV